MLDNSSKYTISQQYTKFQLHIKEKSTHIQIQIYNSLLALLPNGRINRNDDVINSIEFHAENVKSLADFLLEQDGGKMNEYFIIKFIHCLYQQIEYLRNVANPPPTLGSFTASRFMSPSANVGYGYIGFDLNDFIVVNNTIFLNVSSRYISTMTLTTIPKLPYFSNPEIQQLTKLPCEIHIGCSYYSFGMIVVYLYFGQMINDDLLESIQGTKIYWFLQRCFATNAKNRSLLLI